MWDYLLGALVLVFNMWITALQALYMCGTEKQMRMFTGGNGDARGVLKLDVERFRQRLPRLEEISSSESRERRKQLTLPM
jgi:hypothetical protein